LNAPFKLTDRTVRSGSGRHDEPRVSDRRCVSTHRERDPDGARRFDRSAARRTGGGWLARFNFAERRQVLARYEHVPRHVIEARYLGDYKVWLEFNDGRKGVVDLADELYGEQLLPLRDRDRFAQFYLDYGLASIAWPEGQDFAPEFLYDKLKAMN
jgi:hypothetical protein